MSDNVGNKMGNKLLPCPFCKEELEVVGKGHYFAHKINGCILQHLCFECDDIEAISAWNTRKPIESIIERIIERLEDKQNENRYKSYIDTWNVGLDQAIEIVREEGGI